MTPLARVAIALVLVYLSLRLASWLGRRRRLVRCIERLPGPPNIPYLPIINHTLVLIYLDSLRHKLGTYALAYHVMSNMYRLFPDTGICRFWLGWKPVVMLYSAENVESVLTSTSVLDKADEYRFFEPWIGEGLITSKKLKWRLRRRIVTPAFHFRILDDFLPIINDEASKLVRKLNQFQFLGEHRVVDLAPLIALCTLDTICETAMGVNINCQADESSAYVQSIHEACETAFTRITRPWLWLDAVFYRTQAGKRFTRAKNEMHQFTNRVILERKDAWQRQLLQGGHPNTAKQSLTLDNLRASVFFSTGNKRLAFLDLLLHQHLIENTLSIENVREEVDTFMFAGHDTTAMSISWTLYMLGLHEDIQQRVRDELDQILANDDRIEEFQSDEWLARQLKTTDISPEHLQEMKYLDRVIKESLRLWPSIPFVARQMSEDLVVGNKYLIPEGATCMVFTQALHNNPKYFPKPEVFDPDRFLSENTVGRHPFAYIPFSAGPRNCIGQKFAQTEMKVILAKIIRNYHIQTQNQRDKLAVVGELVLRSRNGLNVKFVPRFRQTTLDLAG